MVPYATWVSLQCVWKAAGAQVTQPLCPPRKPCVVFVLFSGIVFMLRGKIGEDTFGQAP